MSMNVDTIAYTGYGLWSLVLINSFIIILFAYSFTKLKTKRNWLTFNLFSVYVIAHFIEMYGFPLTIYWFAAWFSQYFPMVNIYSHKHGHFINNIIRLNEDPHFGFYHALSLFIIFFGLGTIAYAWGILSESQKKKELATVGPYAFVRHPQYVGFILVMLGLLIQWPTVITIVLFPIITYLYVRLSKNEEIELTKQFGPQYQLYAALTPAFFPRLRNL